MLYTHTRNKSVIFFSPSCVKTSKVIAAETINTYLEAKSSVHTSARIPSCIYHFGIFMFSPSRHLSDAEMLRKILLIYCFNKASSKMCASSPCAEIRYPFSEAKNEAKHHVPTPQPLQNTWGRLYLFRMLPSHYHLWQLYITFNVKFSPQQTE